MALQGSLRDFAATEILQLLGSQQKTGCLMLTWNTEHAVVYVQEGRIVSTRKPGLTKDDPLLTFLRRVHRLSDEQYQGILTIQRESQRDVEDLLINGRYVDQEELAMYVERQILDDLMRVTRWESGDYRFDPNNRWPHRPIVSMNIEGAMIEAARRVDEQKRFVTVFRDPYQVLGLRDLPDPDEPLSEEVRELFGIIDGQHTVAQIVEMASLTEYEAYEAIHQMLESSWIEIVGRQDPGRPQVAPAPAVVKPRSSPLRWVYEIVMIFIVAGAVMGLHLLADKVPRSRIDRPDEDIFVAARLRNVGLALDLYALERGSFPPTLQTLVDDRWVSQTEIEMPGHLLQYNPERGGRSYSLDLQPATH
jgi:Domain of unknown function (DUF4388)